MGRQRENHHDSRVSGEEMPKRFGVVFGRGWKGQFSLSFGPGVRGSDPGIPNELLVARCASFGRDVEGVDQGTSSLAPVPCEHSQGRVATPSHSWTAVFSEIRKTFVSLGSDGFSFCGPAGSQERFRRFSAALLCSCAVITPGLASSPVAAVESLPASDFVAAVITLAGALGVLQFFDELAKRDLLEKKLSRKLCHILSGMVFMLLWPLFSSAPQAKWLAALAPAANGLRMIGLGLGIWKNEALVKAISRGGSQSELLHGPLYYAITITISTLCFWRNSPVGAVAVATLCAGDGFADILGRKYGAHKLPYNNSKSFVGSVAFFVIASLASMGYLAYFSAFGFFTATTKMYFATLGVTFASAVAESLPLPLDDNFTVPFTALVVGMLLLPH